MTSDSYVFVCCGSFFFFSSRRRHTRFDCDWSSDVCSSDLDGAKDTVPWFIAPNGPVRETRFKKSNGVPDGNVHALFVITGRQDAAGCNIRQLDRKSVV